MSDGKIDGLFQTTVPCVLAFPNLFQARRFKDKRTGKESGEEKFDGLFVFDADSPDVTAAKALIAGIAKARFPTEYLALVGGDKKALQLPLVNGTMLADNAAAIDKDQEFARGKVCVRARTQFPPFLSAIVNGKVVDFKDDARPAAQPYFYPGVRVIVELNFQPHKVGSNTPGVTAYLNHVLSTNKGDRLTGGAETADKFSAYVGMMTAEDPTAGLDDEIPF